MGAYRLPMRYDNLTDGEKGLRFTRIAPGLLQEVLSPCQAGKPSTGIVQPNTGPRPAVRSDASISSSTAEFLLDICATRSRPIAET